MAILPPFVHLPVSPIGTVPVARQATDLARTPGRYPASSKPIRFRYPDEPARKQSIQIDRVIAAPGRTTVEWTLRSLSDQDTFRLQSNGGPVSSPPPGDVHVLNTSPANGPQLSLTTPRGRERWPTLWIATETYDQPAYECLCTELGLWSSGLRNAGGAAQLTGNYPEVPAGTRTVDIVLPGFGTFRRVPVVKAEDAAAAVLPPVAEPTGQWSYAGREPAPRVVDSRLADRPARSRPARRVPLHCREGRGARPQLTD